MKAKHEEPTEITRYIGYDLLGPVIHRWLLAIHHYISYFDDGGTKFLFCARAGVRLQHLYSIFLQNSDFINSKEIPEVFWISRLSVAKGTYNRTKRAADNISREYQHLPISELIAGILKNQPSLLSRCDLRRNEHKAHGFNFAGWIKGGTPEAIIIEDYLNACSAAFDSYLNSLVDGNNRIVLIDSGWQGTTQSLLVHAYPKYVWKGLYFGRIKMDGHDPSIMDDVIGLMFQHDIYEPAVPESAFIEHRHIIETLLEPNAPSIEEVPFHPFSDSAKSLISSNLHEKPDVQKDALYLYVLDYLKDQKGRSNFSEILSAHNSAMKELARIILTPTRSEAYSLYCKDRSADFGKTLKVPVLITPGDSIHTDSEKRIANALWRQGQIALEYEDDVAHELQLRSIGLSDSTKFFDPLAVDASLSSQRQHASLNTNADIAVITRTKNRPLLLKRASKSISSQTYNNYTWVVVNDGGDEDVVRNIIENSTVDRQKILLVSNRISMGMEAASNLGIRASNSDYIVIHDDDDSWSPLFLQTTIKFLESPPGKRYGGVITHSVYISEEIKGQQVIEHSRKPYQDWVRNVQLMEMAVGNFYPPIAFVFRRSVYDDIGGYNEELPVLGDWYFNLEFLLRADIAVIPQPLANYHHRDVGDTQSGIYSNSVIGGITKHEEFNAVVRNRFLRSNISRFPAAAAVMQGYVMNDARHRLISDHSVSSSSMNDLYESQYLQDKYWTIAQVNFLISNSNLLTKIINGLSVAVAPDASINEILPIVQKYNLKIKPPPDFDEMSYLSANQDVVMAVNNGEFPNGFIHYLTHGYREGRIRPSHKRK